MCHKEAPKPYRRRTIFVSLLCAFMNFAISSDDVLSSIVRYGIVWMLCNFNCTPKISWLYKKSATKNDNFRNIRTTPMTVVVCWKFVTVSYGRYISVKWLFGVFISWHFCQPTTAGYSTTKSSDIKRLRCIWCLLYYFFLNEIVLRRRFEGRSLTRWDYLLIDKELEIKV